MEISKNEMAHLFVSRMLDKKEADKNKAYSDAIKIAYKAIELCKIATSEVLSGVNVEDYSLDGAVSNHKRWDEIEHILKYMKNPKEKADDLYDKYKKKSIDVVCDILSESNPTINPRLEYYDLVIKELENIIK